MADYRIGVARLDVPDVLPQEGIADSTEAKSVSVPKFGNSKHGTTGAEN